MTRLSRLSLRLVVILVWLNSNDLVAQDARAYQLFLKSGVVSPVSNLDALKPDRARLGAGESSAPRLTIIQFFDIPLPETVQQLAAGGIRLLDYVPDFAYTASVTAGWDADLLRNAGVRAVFELEPRHKLHPALLVTPLPRHAVQESGKVDVLVSCMPVNAFNKIQQELSALGADLRRDPDDRVLEMRIAAKQLLALAALPWVQYVEAVPPPVEALNDKSGSGTRANVLRSAVPGQRGLDGAGVVIGIGDTGELSEHIDVSSRVVSFQPAGSHWHGVHVAGTAAGAGIMNEKYSGYAPKAAIVKRANSEIWRQAPALVRDFGMVVANNAYGGSVCPDHGSYTFESYTLDQQAAELPHLQQVFAAGNSGSLSCGIFPAGFGNVLGGYISAKNVITVGNTGTDGLIVAASSKGPVLDGRIKPDLTAPGTGIVSTTPVNAYAPGSGTSMASPAVTGGLALLYQRYRQLHQQQNPKNMLMKALLINGATDKGLPGPDYSYGFGAMNLLRSVTMLEKGTYFNGRLAHHGKDGFEIQVPANTALVKIMLYWNDAAPAMLAGGKSLVNDLDLKVLTPAKSELLPVFPRPATPGLAAVAGVDTLNNIEQIVLDAPAAGNYQLSISGTKVPSGPQEYFLVYDIIPFSTQLTYPAGGEKLTRGDAIDIAWDSYGHAGSTFSVSYSLNDGGSWTNIQSAVPAGTSQLSWTVQEATTTQAKIRIIQNATGAVTEGAPFTILGVPTLSLSASQCETSAAVQWTTVSGATDYEVMRMQGNEMRHVAVTKELKYVLSGLSRDSTYYISVRARLNGVPGRRALAVFRKPDSGNCDGADSDADLAVDAILAPAPAGRMLTSTALGSAEVVRVRIKNLDDQAVTQPFQVGYAVGAADAQVHWETVEADIAANGQLDYAFARTLDVRSPGAYVLTVQVKFPGDAVTTNNQKTMQVRQLPNDPVKLPFFDNLEVLRADEVYSNIMGVAGTDRYDFAQEGGLGRLRTAITSPALAYSGNRAFTFDANSGSGASYPTQLDATYNLAAYHADRDEVRLTFRYRHYASSGRDWPLNVYIRPSDADPWITALDYGAVPYFSEDHQYALVSIDVSSILKQHAKPFSTSFQVRWEQTFQYPARLDGATIDDIRLFTTTSDAEITRIEAAALPSCDPGGYQEYHVLVKNNGADDLFRVPIEARINQQLIQAALVPVVRAGRDTLFTFGFFSNHHINADRVVRIALKKPFDSNPGNDSKTIQVKPAGQTLASFPYLEDFESGPGGWYLTPANPGWALGLPAKTGVAASGSRAWAAQPAGGVAYLYSPCFNMGGLAQPTLSFSLSLDLAACEGGACDMAYVEYSIGGNSWMRLGGVNSGTNWYNARQDNADGWNVQGYSRWHMATAPIPAYFPGGYVRFRFVLDSRTASGRGGIAIDDIHLYDAQAMVYANASVRSERASAQVAGNDWVPFKLHNTLVAAIHPNGQALGNVSVQTFQSEGPMRIQNRQYYLSRSFAIDAPESFAQPVRVRLYITDEEAERLVLAPEKPGIAKLASAYELTVTRYSGSNEDGDISNNGNVNWFFHAKQEVRKVPYAQGYYLEFSTKNFSEFWFAKEFIGPATALPVTLAGFTAAQDGNTARLTWRTAAEENASHFEVQRSGDARSWNILEKGIAATGEGSSYQTTDAFPLAGMNYYRLRMVDLDGTFAFSQVAAVPFDVPSAVSVFPNPVSDKAHIRTVRRVAFARLHAASGLEVARAAQGATVLDVSGVQPGMHSLTIHYEDGSQSQHKILIIH